MIEQKAILTVALTSRALFDIREEHGLFKTGDLQGYIALQAERINQAPAPGAAFALVQKLLSLNEGQEHPMVEVAILSRNDPWSGLRMMRAIEHYRLPITRSIWTSGEPPYRYLQPLGAQLFLSAEATDVHAALAAGHAAATVVDHRGNSFSASRPDQLRMAFDFDCVLAGNEAQRVFDEAVGDKLTAFHTHEDLKRGTPMAPGPMQPLLSRLAQIQEACPGRIRTGLFTARMAPAHERPLATLSAWGLAVDEVFFLGGMPKGPFLAQWGADFFLDDSHSHAEGAAMAGVLSGLVQ